ncbi:uncharacterized protein LOC131151521 [Malania oleifera]|uniref:uncharacterized protein LOC131151521 n=1 Tax=Malania oleifera TaxID=397392 RepID=UPI0025AE45D0|nr:uncharacterized protein LOC131151521 [Malania oleifera]
MDDFRSKSYGDARMQMEGRAPTSYPIDLQSYGANPYPPSQVVAVGAVRDFKLKKGKSASASSSKGWGLGDPEFQRKKRVASYKVYAVEGRVKGSLRRSFRWLKDKYSQML